MAAPESAATCNMTVAAEQNKFVLAHANPAIHRRFTLNAILPRDSEGTLAIVDYHQTDSGTFIQ
jgi:hypothetical protein